VTPYHGLVIDPIALFSSSYAEARARFVEAASKHPHLVERGALSIDAEHTIDWALTGDPSAEDVLVYTSALHGIEGYAGGAVMLRLLGLGERTTVLWMHALNPWGMARFRRVNEGNVDLNRNFLPDGAPYTADDDAYAALDALLNPPRPPGPDAFLLGAAYHLARHGLGSLRNAVARGQYSFPKGIFYGGQAREATTREVLGFLPARLVGKRRVVHVDLHTARGPRGDYVAFLEGADPAARSRAELIFGARLRAWAANTADGYDMRGGMLPELQRRVPGARYDAITLEFGTASDLGIVRALRAENQLHFWGERDAGPDHPARRAMRGAFYPDDARWRASVISHAVSIHRQAERLLASG
jgi:hypothetical protein